jgi:antitoxin HicB
VKREDGLKLVYPASLTHAEEGGFLVSFRDFPEAHTEGQSESEALDQASDCLEEVLALYIAERRNIPQPSSRRQGERSVAPGSLIGAKTALYIALARAGLSQRELARRMGADVSHVTRLLDPKHRSRLDQIDLAMRALGARLTLSVDEAA